MVAEPGAEGAWIAHGEPHVLVEVKGIHPAPVEPLELGKRVEHGLLRRRGSEDRPAARLRREDAPHLLGSMLRRGGSHGHAVLEHDGPQAVAPKLGHWRSGMKTTKKT
jgi:hypothetical protein